MSPVAPLVAALSERIAHLSAELGPGVDVGRLGVTDRSDQLRLRPPGRISPNGACRLIRAADGWLALNLARPEDRDLLPAWLGTGFEALDWPQVERLVRPKRRAPLVAAGAELGLPVAAVGEVESRNLDAPVLRFGQGRRDRGASLTVVDLSALWAGPLCGAILAEAGAQVVKVESPARPDPTRMSTPAFDHRLNGRKRLLNLDLGARGGREHLWSMVRAADVLITSARPRAISSLGLEPRAVFAANPGMVWVAITGYGWTDPPPGRVAFGDDAAAAGGLMGATAGGEPAFLGDALADPITGLVAAIGALNGLAQGGGLLVDAALARCAAAASAAIGAVEAA